VCFGSGVGGELMPVFRGGFEYFQLNGLRKEKKCSFKPFFLFYQGAVSQFHCEQLLAPDLKTTEFLDSLVFG
jgi:hypothetical protein